MALFLVQHQHSPESCPAGNREMVQQLAAHVSPENAGNFGIKVLADSVLQGEHALLLVLEAESQETIERFVQPFRGVGSVTVKPNLTCGQVAAGLGSCAG